MQNTIENLYSKYIESGLVSTDTRKIIPRSIFFALKGSNFNGNEFAQQALDAGASYAVIDEKKYKTSDRFILVNDVLESLQQLATYHRRQLHFPFLAITGSNGKTTTKELINIVLKQKYKTHATSGNLNNHIGVPLTILAINKGIEFAVIEMGANHQKEIAFLCEIAQPDYGLITNIGKAHLEGFGGIEGVKKGKGELYDYLRKSDGKIFLYKDSEDLMDMSGGLSTYTYGRSYADITGEITEENPFVNVSWQTKHSATHKIQTQLIGGYNLPNILAAVAVGNFFNVEHQSINSAIASYVPDNNRSQVIQKNSITIIMDAYNANPSSMEAAINNFAKMKGKNKVLFLGDMLELGTETETAHQEIADLVKKNKLSEVYLVGKLFSATSSDYKKFPDAQACREYISTMSFKDKMILFKGSRGIKLETIAEAIN